MRIEFRDIWPAISLLLSAMHSEAPAAGILRAGEMLMDLAGADERTWGAVSWRRSHQFDPPHIQEAGWTVNEVFQHPVSLATARAYKAQLQDPTRWLCAYQVEIVPFTEQASAAEARRLSLLKPAPGERPTPPLSLVLPAPYPASGADQSPRSETSP